MKLTKAETTKTLEVTTSHDYDEKYMVILNEGFANEGEEVGFFNTQKEVKTFIKGAELVQSNSSKAEEEEMEYNGFYSNEVQGEWGYQTINTAREGNFFNGYTKLRMERLREGIEGRDLHLDTVLKELVKYKKELAYGHTVDVYLQWNLSEDKMEYTSCKVVKTVVSTFNTPKERLEARCNALGYKVTFYDKDIDTLDEKAFAEVLEQSSEEYTDVVVVSKGKTYVVEIATIDNEKDFVLYTKERYIDKYGDEKFQDE